MALNTRSPLAPYWYVLEDEYEDDPETGERKPKEDAAAFLVNGLDGFQMAEVQAESFIDKVGNIHFTRAGIMKAFKYGLTNWRNVNHNGKEAKFQKNMAENMKILAMGTMNEITAEIVFVASDLTEDEEKN